MRKHFDHDTPGWVPPERTYFLTVCAQNRKENTFCHLAMGRAILDSIRLRNEHRIWFCNLAVLMPDHIHLILDFTDERPMAKAMRDWKSYLARIHGIVWQRNYFDHRLRGEEQFSVKAEYVFLNPERAGLIDQAVNWPYTWQASGQSIGCGTR